MSDHVTDFAELMGTIFQSDGGPRNAGRVFGLLLIDGRAMTLQEIADRLRISRASANTNARQLERHGLVRVVSRTGERHAYYEVVRDPYKDMVATLGAGMDKKARQLAQAAADLPADWSESRARVERLATFYQTSVELFDEWARKLPARRS